MRPLPGRRLRQKLAGAAFLLLASVCAATNAAAQLPVAPPAPGGGLPIDPVGVLDAGLDAFGLGLGDQFGQVGHDHAHGVMDSAWNLAEIDPLTGALLPEDVTQALGDDLATAHDLMAADQMALDARRLAEQARAEAERKKAAQRRQGIAVGERRSDGVPQDWEIKNFSACGSSANTSHRARIETVDAFEALCQAAAGDGVRLIINSSLRTAARQRELFSQAVNKYGSATAAAKWVARPEADGSCTSRHCKGIALDISTGGGAERWMHAAVGCLTDGGRMDTSRTSCGRGERSVKRVQLYGFIIPMAHEPWHIELGIPIDADMGDGPTAASCDPPRSHTVPQMIGAIWRCRLAEAGITGTEANRIVAEALVVSKCESGWNAEVVIHGGKYVNRKHPSTGTFFTAAGVFQFVRGSADAWVRGGYANVRDPIANIDAAARYYISQRKAGRDPWSPWECAAVNGRIAKKSVLPGYPGGPAALPDWAYSY